MLTITPSWRGHIRDWERTLRAAGRPESTRKLRCYQLRRFAADHPRLQLRHVTGDHLLDWMTARDWGLETRRNYRASLRLFFAWAHATGKISHNPAHALPTVRPARAVPRPAPDTVVRGALAVADKRVYTAIVVIAATGMRRFEAAKIHTEDLERGMDGWQLRIRGKGGHGRIVPVSDRIATIIRSHPEGFVFPGRIDGHLSPAYLGKLISRVLGPGWTPHTLRHRYASVAYSVDRDIRAVQELLGHSSVATTQIYTAVPDDARRRAASAAEIAA